MFPASVQKLIDALTRLPGVGKKTAQHYAYFLLRSHRSISRDICSALNEMETQASFCKNCFMLCDNGLCSICKNARRDINTICVVEQIFDVEAIERSGEFHGVYHVLHGRIAPLDNISPEDIKIKELVIRVKSLMQEGHGVEVILATNPSSEGEATAIYIQRLLNPLNVNITRIATGIPVGADLEYADEITLARALKGRQKY